MKKNIASILFVALFALVLSISTAFAVQDFSLSTTTLSETVSVSSAGGSSFTVTNTGNETLNLNVVKVNPTGGAGTINLNLGSTTITNLAPGNSSTVSYTFTAGTSLGTSSGNIFIRNQANTSQEKNVSVVITTTAASGASLEIEGVTSTIVINADVGKEDDVRLRFRNNGNITITDIRLEVGGDFDGRDSSDEIEDNDFDFDPDDSFELEVGETENIDFIVDVPNDVSADTYEGVLEVSTDQGDFTWLVEVIVEGGDDEISIGRNSLEVRDGVLEMTGEAGENVDNFEFLVINDGNTDFRDVTFQLDGDLEEEFSSNTIPASAVTFNPSSTDVDRDDEEDIEVEIDIPEDTPSGTYFADIELLDSDGDKLDDIILKLRVVGDVFIKEITYEKEVSPGDRLDVDVTVENKGSQIFRDVQISAVIFDVDEGTEDLREVSSTFLLDVGDEKTKRITFDIPYYASDGGHTMEIRLKFNNQEVVEIEEVIIVRPAHFIRINSVAVNPGVAKCVDNIYAFMNAENLGSSDERRVEVSAEIIGTGVRQSTSVLELDEDEKLQKSLTLDISTLEPGTYTVEHKITYDNGAKEDFRDSKLIIAECKNTVGVTVNNNVSVSSGGNDTIDNSSKVVLFGQELEKTTVYLGTGVGVVLLLIVISLFFV